MNDFSNFFLFFCKEEVKTPLIFLVLMYRYSMYLYIYIHVIIYIKKKKPSFLYMHIQYINTNFQCPWIKYVMIRTSSTTKITYIFKKWQLLDMCSYFKNKKNIVEKLFYFYFFSRRTNFSILFLFFFPPPTQIIWKIFRKSKN